MAKNLTEVIVNIEPSHRKEFHHVTSYRGKIASAANTFIYDFVVTFFFTATLRSRSKKRKKNQYFCQATGTGTWDLGPRT